MKEAIILRCRRVPHQTGMRH